MSSGKTSFKVSVRDLASFVARSGDLRSSGFAGPTAQQGIAGHKRLRETKGEQWQAEVAVKEVFTQGEVDLTLSGRADFVRQEQHSLLVEELKTCLGDPAATPIASDNWAQAKLYAWLLSREQTEQPNHPPITVRLTRLDIVSGELLSQDQNLGFTELDEQCQEWLATYLHWCQLLVGRQQSVRVGCQQLPFPFAQYRPEQRSAARFVYRCIRERENLILDAPTGSGKTMTMLFPVAKALGEALVSKVVVLSAKTSGQQVIIEALEQLQGLGMSACVVQISAKSRLCPCKLAADSSVAEPELCARREGFYDRLPQARIHALKEAWLSSDRLLAIAEQHAICPFELSLEMAPWADVVVADLNYWFDPLVRLSLFEQMPAPLLVMDEVHNLVERAREQFSARISESDFWDLDEALNISQWPKSAQRKNRRCRTLLAGLMPSAGAPEQSLPKVPEPFTKAVADLFLHLTQGEPQQLAPNSLLPAPNWGELLSPLRRWLTIAELYSDAHITLVKAEGGHSGKAKARVASELLCLNPAQFVAARSQAAASILACSATLRPVDFYLDHFGWQRETPEPIEGAKEQQALHWLPLSCHFPRENRGLFVAPFVDTRWQARAGSIHQLADLLAAVVRAQTGNYLVFLPSYSYLNLLAETLAERAFPSEVLVQPNSSDVNQRQEFIDGFVGTAKATLGLVVLGGVFAEALDLANDALQGVVVIGTGMGQPGEFNRRLDQYWRGQGRDGFDYAFRAPGFARVQQAAGRVVRSPTDRGTIVLVDPRFAGPTFQRWFPPHWATRETVSEAELELSLRDFWQS